MLADASVLPAFKPGNDPRTAWESWIKALERYLSLSKITDDQQKLDYLLVMGGIEMQQIYDRIEKYDVHLSTVGETPVHSGYKSAKETL